LSAEQGPFAGWAGWLDRLEDELGPGRFDGADAGALGRIVARVIEGARLRGGDAVVDLGAGTGLLTLEAARAVGPSGTVTAVDSDPGCLAETSARARVAGLSNVTTVQGPLEAVPLTGGAFDSVVCRSALSYSGSVQAAALEVRRLLRAGGTFSVFEPLLGELEWDLVTGGPGEPFLEMERALKEGGGPRAVTRSLLRDAFSGAGLEHVSLTVHYTVSGRGGNEEDLAREYLYDLPADICAFTVLKKAGFAEEQIENVAERFGRAASRGEIRGRLPCLFLRGEKPA